MSERRQEPRFDSRPDTHQHIAHVRGLLDGAAGDMIRRGHVHDEPDGVMLRAVRYSGDPNSNLESSGLTSLNVSTREAPT